MSKKQFIEFYTKFIDPNQDLKLELAKADSEEQFMKILAPLAKEANAKFTMEDVAETVACEMKFVLESLKRKGDPRLDHRDTFFNPLGTKILSMGNDMGTCHC